MPCKEWRDDWVAHLYGELSPEDQDKINAHLAGCSACSETMRDLGDSRRVLEAGAPAVPSAPRVVVLRPRNPWRPGWAFASGLAAATLVFLVGVLAAPDRPAPAAVPSAEVAGRIRALQERVDGLEQEPRPVQAQPAGDDVITREQLDREIELVSRRFRRQRAEDLDYLARWLAASEQRTGTFIDRTQDALTYLALRGDPRVNQR